MLILLGLVHCTTANCKNRRQPYNHRAEYNTGNSVMA